MTVTAISVWKIHPKRVASLAGKEVQFTKLWYARWALFFKCTVPSPPVVTPRMLRLIYCTVLCVTVLRSQNPGLGIHSSCFFMFCPICQLGLRQRQLLSILYTHLMSQQQNLQPNIPMRGISYQGTHFTVYPYLCQCSVKTCYPLSCAT